jgi:hypothetical protein
MKHEIPYIRSFDTKTKEAELLIVRPDKTGVVVANESKNEVLKVKVKIPGAVAVNKVTGKLYE